MPPNTAPRTPPKTELALLDQVERLYGLREGRSAVLINLSLLSRANRRAEYTRVAIDTFLNSINGMDGQAFVLDNNDIFYLARNVTPTVLQASVERLRVLFRNDPLVAAGDNKGDEGFCVWYNLESQYEDLLKSAQEHLKLAEQSRVNPGLDLLLGNEPAPLPAVQPELLAKLEQSLAGTDISSIVRRQTICSLFDNRAPLPLFDEFFVSIDNLQQVTTPGTDLKGNRWLFQHLTRSLDRRMLLMLMRDHTRDERPFSLNLNLETILSPEFARFQDVVSPQMRGRLVVELNKVDVFADMSTYFFARDYLRDHGFRLCLDGLTHHTLPYYDREKLGFDLIKLYWTPDSVDTMSEDMIPALRNVVMEAGQARTIMCRCEDPRSIEIGQQLGIIMFQGRYVDRLLTESRPA